jgi:hypothetical protein
MPGIAPGEAVVEGEVYVRVRGLLRHIFSIEGGFWLASVRIRTTHPYGFQAVNVPLGEVMVVDADHPHDPMRPPAA